MPLLALVLLIAWLVIVAVAESRATPTARTAREPAGSSRWWGPPDRVDPNDRTGLDRDGSLTRR